jgi:hypothetical protein
MIHLDHMQRVRVGGPDAWDEARRAEEWGEKTARALLGHRSLVYLVKRAVLAVPYVPVNHPNQMECNQDLKKQKNKIWLCYKN